MFPEEECCERQTGTSSLQEDNAAIQRSWESGKAGKS